MSKHKVIFPQNLIIEAETGATLKELMNREGIEFDFPCGGRGKCGKCKVRISTGAGEPLDEEKRVLTAKEIAEGIRLACLTRVKGDMRVEFLSDKKIGHQILLSGLDRTVAIDPHISKKYLEVDKATVRDMRTDWQRIKDRLAAQGDEYRNAKIRLPVLRAIPGLMNNTGAKMTAVFYNYNNKVRGLENGDTSGRLLGIAFDIGTTTIVGYLVDLYTGKELSVVSTLNPQTQYGADVISRITYASQNPRGLDDLHRAVTGALNSLIGEATKSAGVSRNDIYAITAVGNTCMHHLFVGINPQSVALAPYVPVVSDALQGDPSDFNLEINPAGKVFVLPNIAGFVGADTAAVLLATDFDKSEDIRLVVDIGTNGEIALGNKDRILACSTAAGPAFEGAQITCGMRGATGAIDHVIFGGNLEYSVIGNVEPIGICGSALLDTVAGLVENGLIDERGRFMEPEEVTHPVGKKLKDRLIRYNEKPAFLISGSFDDTGSRPVLVTQKDIRELQLAKGAMATGIKILMKNYGLQAEDIKEVLLAGAFGNYLDPHSACAIGLIPAELEGRIKMIGNAAGAGAKLALLSAAEYRRAEQAARKVEFVELGSDPDFTSVFAESMLFPAQENGSKS